MSNQLVELKKPVGVVHCCGREPELGNHNKLRSEMSEILNLLREQAAAIKKLRNGCKHPKRMIVVSHDKSSIGAGTLYGAVVVICTNCGKKKIIFDLDSEARKRVRKQLTRQGGFKDERVGLYATEGELSYWGRYRE